MYSIYIAFTLLLTICQSIEISESFSGHVECLKSKIDRNVTLAFGHHAGLFYKANKSITSMKRCVQQCCQMKGCDVSFFSNGACYSVKCTNFATCAPKVNSDKRMNVLISFVAKPFHQPNKEPVTDKFGEPALTEDLIAEVTKESPFKNDGGLDSYDDIKSSVPLKRHRRESWYEYKDITIALIAGFAAVAVGVVGVITMTRKLVEDDDDMYSSVEDDIWNDDPTSLETLGKICSKGKSKTVDMQANQNSKN